MDIVISIVPILGAGVLALMIPLGLIFVDRISKSFSDSQRAGAILTFIAFGAALVVLGSPRELGEAARIGTHVESVESGGSQLSILAGRVFNLLLVGLCASWLFAALWRRPSSPSGDPALPLLVSVLTYLFGTAVGQAFGSSEPSWTYKSLYIPIVLGGLYIQSDAKPLALARVAKLLAMLVCVASLLFAVIRPDLALERPYESLIPGLNFRLYGVTGHANAMGPMALLYLLLEWHVPSKRLLRWPAIIVALSCFLFAQSKTAWATGVILGLLIIFHSTVGRQNGGNAKKSLLLLTILFGGLAAVAIALMFVDLGGFLERHSEFTTLTGRTDLWRITMDEWRRNPVFGYGAGLWDEDFRIRYNILYAGQAHNQFVQTLGESGLVGFALLLQYLVVLAFFCLQQARLANPLPLLLFILILARCVSEAPMRAIALLDWALLMHALLFLLLAQHVRGQQQLLRAGLPLASSMRQARTVAESEGGVVKSG